MHGSGQILIVEDEAPLRELYATWLGQEYEVCAVPDGESALEGLRDVEPDVVTLDRELPGITGLEVARRIRRRGLDCRLVVVSSRRKDFDVGESPIDAHLHKPVTSNTLCSACTPRSRSVASL